MKRMYFAQNENITNEIMPKIETLPTKGIEPRQFCRIWFGVNHLPPSEIADYETQSGYRRECIMLLAKVLGVAECSVRRWGDGLNFAMIPEYHKLSLAYALKAADLLPSPDHREAA